MFEKMRIPGAKIIGIENSVEGGYLPKQIMPAEIVHATLPNLHSFIDNNDRIFGKDVFEDSAIIDHMNNYYLHNPNKNKDLVNHYQSVKDSKIRLNTIIQKVIGANKKTQEGINLFFALALQNTDLKKQYLELLMLKGTEIEANNKEQPNNMLLAKYFETIQDSIPDDLYIKMLIWYQIGFEYRNRQLKKGLRSFFNNEISSYIAEFAGSYDLDNDCLQKRFKSLKSRLNLNFTDSNLLSANASLGSTNNRGDIVLNPFHGNMRVLKSALVHETIHNLAGTKYRVLPLKQEVAEGVVNIFMAVPEKQGGMLYKHLGWFNEGVTEIISQQVYPTEALSYPNEISLITKILFTGKQEISLTQLFKAYFEGIDANVDKEKELKETKGFYEQVSQAWSPGFLNRLDQLISLFLGKVHISLVNDKFEKIAKLIMTNRPIEDLSIDYLGLFLSDGPLILG